MTKIKITDLRKQLKALNEKELIEIIVDLYKADKAAQEFLSVKFLGADAVEELFEKAKKEMKNEFFPDKGFGTLRLAVAKRAISQFKKLTNDHEKTIELMLVYVDSGTRFTKAYGDIDEKFYNSMESMYRNVIKECEKSKELFDQFDYWLWEIVEDSYEVGWGYHDVLLDCYHTLSWLDNDE